VPQGRQVLFIDCCAGDFDTEDGDGREEEQGEKEF